MPKEKTYKIVGSVLKWGSWISVIALILGIILFLIHPSPSEFGTIQGKEFWRKLLHSDSQSLMNLGILLMILVPFFRVLAIGISFVIEKDRKYSLISATVLIFLILGIFLAIFQV